MLAQSFYKLHLLFSCQASDCLLNKTADRCLRDGNEARIVHESEESHDELTVHAVSHASMARNRVAKVFDVECALKPRRKETAKWCNK